MGGCGSVESGKGGYFLMKPSSSLCQPKKGCRMKPGSQAAVGIPHCPPPHQGGAEEKPVWKGGKRVWDQGVEVMRLEAGGRLGG